LIEVTTRNFSFSFLDSSRTFFSQHWISPPLLFGAILLVVLVAEVDWKTRCVIRYYEKWFY